MAKFKASPKQGPPAYMVSFCDMMTLILTFFILLVSMSEEQQAGLVARGLGSFIVAIKTHGLDGIMSGEKKMEIFEEVRRKFNLPPEDNPERRTEFFDASNLELIKGKLLESLEPHDELTFSGVASFAPDSAELSGGARTYLQKLAPSFQPKFSQLLVIEGHANDAGAAYLGDDRQLAVARAHAVREFLIEECGFSPHRLQARAWFVELGDERLDNNTAYVRLVTSASR